MFLERESLKKDNSEKERYENDASGKGSLKKDNSEQRISEKWQIWKDNSEKGRFEKGKDWKGANLEMESVKNDKLIMNRKMFKGNIL